MNLQDSTNFVTKHFEHKNFIEQNKTKQMENDSNERKTKRLKVEGKNISEF